MKFTHFHLKDLKELEIGPAKESALEKLDYIAKRISIDTSVNDILESIFIITKTDPKHISIEYNPGFVPNDVAEISHFIKKLEILFNVLTSCYNTKGYINDARINVYGLKEFLISTNVLRGGKVKFVNPSLLTNTLFFNLVLLGVYISIVHVEKSTVLILEEDLKADLKVLKSKVLTMINPIIKDRLRNKSVIVSINGFVGFDTEYESESTRELKNRLLSIQLASTSNLTMLVPKTKLKPLKAFDFKSNSPSGWGDNLGVKIITEGLDTFIDYYRNTFMGRSLKALELIHDHYSGLRKFDNDSFSIYATEKAKFSTKIRHFYYSFNTNVPTIVTSEVIPSKVFDVPFYSMENLLSDSESMVDDEHYKNIAGLISTIDDLLDKNKTEEFPDSSSKELMIDGRVHKAVEGPYSRISYGLGDEKFNISVWKNLYMILHESSADLSMLSDFKDFKDSFDIIDRSFVTMGKPFELKSFADSLKEVPDKKLLNAVGSRVFFRDTVLIAPAGIKSLASIGNIYGPEYRKIDIGNYREGNMSNLRSEDPVLFDQYAIQDAVITLKHGISMEEFNLSLGRIGVPLTMSGIGKSYVELEWSKEGYTGYQLDSDVFIGDLGTSLTPKKSRDVGFSKHIVMFLASYRGGRNESFMYGLDTYNVWFDYDLTSCYTTVMSLLGTPNYDKTRVLNGNEVIQMSDQDLIFSYTSLEVTFSFPKKVKYPCIPTRVDDDVDIYPLKGVSIITGVEYLIAKAMGCSITVKSAVCVPFVFFKDLKYKKINTSEMLTLYKSPFRHIVKKLQSLRRLHPKKTFFNLMFKEIGNSIYGQIAMGLSGKNKFDVSSKSYKKIQGSFLTNPLLASYITGFTRALIAECLHNINVLGGDVVSVTTDGFICNIEDLENKILESPHTTKTLLLIYRDLRTILTTFDSEKDKDKDKDKDNTNESAPELNVITHNNLNNEDCIDPRALEVKTTESEGLLSWKTRGQLGRSGSIIATTGFQNKSISRDYLFNIFKEIITNKEGQKDFQYIMQRLLGAVDVYKKDCNVMMVYSDRRYELCYDNKRSIIETSIEKDCKSIFYDSKPWQSICEYGHIRYMKNLVNKPVYNKGYVYSSGNTYHERLETSVRGFIVACVSNDRRFGVPINAFSNYKEIKDFIHNYEPASNIKITPSMISNLKHRNTIPRSVPRNKENEKFIEYVKNFIPTFEVDNFFKELSSEAIKVLKDNRKQNKIK